MLRGLIGDLRALAQLGDVLREFEGAPAQKARDAEAGVIELEEVAPGVFAPPKRRQPNPEVSRTIKDVGELGQVLGEVKRAWKR